MSLSRRSFDHAMPLTMSDLPALGIPRSLVAALAHEFGKDGYGNIIGGIDPDREEPPTAYPSGPFLYDWSDADERDGSR